MTDYAQPAYSIGKDQRSGQPRKDRDLAQVGPGSYVQNLADRKKEPAYSMGAKFAVETNKLDVPGAGSYEPPSKIVESQGKTMGTKFQIKDPSGKLGPGPGGYNVDKKKHQDVSYSMGAKLEDIHFQKNIYQPGPGAHSPEKRKDIPSMKFGSGQRSKMDTNTMSPGPGAYVHGQSSSIQKSAPRFGFGTSKRDEAQNSAKQVPGPGNYSQKDLVGKDFPSYSMGGLSTYNPDAREQKGKPGPGNYNPGTGSVKKQEPAYKIGTSTRRDLMFEKAQGFQTSPGQYDPIPEKTKLKAAGWRIGTEQRKGMVTKGQERVPGAGTYAIPSRISDGPKVHMHAKTDQVDQNLKKNVPGPGQYDMQNSPGNRNGRAAAYTMGTGSRTDLGGSKAQKSMPGPGNYNTSLGNLKSPPKYGFGSEKRANVVSKFTTPAPGEYNQRNLIGKDGGVSLTMSPLYHDDHKKKQDVSQPGPGAYEHNARMGKTAPNYGFGSSVRAANLNGDKKVTTEHKYDPKSVITKQSAPKYAFGSQKRQMFDDKQSKETPAPGRYSLDSAAFNNKHRFAMGVKLKDQQPLNVPGSGSYNPSESLTKKASAGYSMGIRLKGGLSQSMVEIPGPGQYSGDTSKQRQSAPKFGFGTSKRPDVTGKKQTNTPGPGDYKLNSKISNVQDFAMPGRNQNSKYV